MDNFKNGFYSRNIAPGPIPIYHSGLYDRFDYLNLRPYQLRIPSDALNNRFLESIKRSTYLQREQMN